MKSTLSTLLFSLLFAGQLVLLATAANAEINETTASQPATRSQSPTSASTKSGKVMPDHEWTPPKTPPPGTKAEAEIFSPVIEQIVEPCAPHGFPALDLETGKMVTSGEAMPETSDMGSTAMEAWRQKAGADIVVVPIPNKNWQIRHFLQQVQVRSRYWDEAALSPQQVRNWLLAANSASGLMSFSNTPDPATYLFQTRNGTAGIMQLLDVADHPRGVKIRYKLVQSAALAETRPGTPSAVGGAEPDSSAAAALAAGEVIERVLDFDTRRATAYLDLDTGQYFDPGAKEMTYGGPSTPAGVDLKASAIESSYRVRLGINLAVVPVDAARWDAAPDEIHKSFAGVQRQAEVRLDSRSQSNTFFFRTSEGGMGVMRLLPAGNSADTSQVLVRYRLIPTTPKPAKLLTADQVAVEDLALRLLAAIRDKDDAALKDLAVDRVKGWRDALPQFAFEMRERFQQMAGKPFAMAVAESLVQGDFAAVKCTGPKELNGTYLVLFLVKTNDGWRNASLRNSPPAIYLATHLAEFQAENK